MTLVFRRMFKIESEDTQTRIRASELSQDAILFYSKDFRCDGELSVTTGQM